MMPANPSHNPEPNLASAYQISCGFEQRTVVGYDAMRSAVFEMSQAAWDAAGQPLDPAWPSASAEEHKWERVDDLRVVRHPNGVEILVAEVRDAH